MIPQNIPTINPIIISNKVCWPTIMRAVPIDPDKRMKPQSHPVGLKLKIRLYGSRLPVSRPQQAVWVLIFHLKLMAPHSNIQNKVVVTMAERWGGAKIRYRMTEQVQ